MPQHAQITLAIPESEKRVPRWVNVVVIAGALLMIAGALLAFLRPSMLLSPDDGITNGVRVYAGYLFSRNLAFAVVLLVALRLRSMGALKVLMALYALVQLLDAVMDGLEGRWSIVPGIVVLGILFVAGARRVPASWRGDQRVD